MTTIESDVVQWQNSYDVRAHGELGTGQFLSFANFRKGGINGHTAPVCNVCKLLALPGVTFTPKEAGVVSNAIAAVVEPEISVAPTPAPMPEIDPHKDHVILSWHDLPEGGIARVFGPMALEEAQILVRPGEFVTKITPLSVR